MSDFSRGTIVKYLGRSFRSRGHEKTIGVPNLQGLELFDIPVCPGATSPEKCSFRALQPHKKVSRKSDWLYQSVSS